MIRRYYVPGRGVVYLETESSPLSLSLDEGLGRFSLRRVARAVFRPVAAPAKILTKVMPGSSAVKSVSNVIGKATSLPAKVATTALAKTVSVTVPGKTGDRLAANIQRYGQKGSTIVGQGAALLTTAAIAPAVVAASTVTQANPLKGIESGFKSMRQTAQAVGGRTYDQSVAAAKVVAPVAAAFVPVVGPVLSVALTAAITSRDVYMKHQQDVEARRDLNANFASAYQTYVDQVRQAGYEPVSKEVFDAWALSGAQGELPIGGKTGAPAGGAPAKQGNLLPMALLALSIFK